jgi:hypothetical protein
MYGEHFLPLAGSEPAASIHAIPTTQPAELAGTTPQKVDQVGFFYKKKKNQT